MSVSHIVTLNWTNGGTPLTKSVTLTSDAEDNRDLAIADSTTNGAVEIAWTNSKLKSIYISSDQAITIKTNSSGSPQETLSIAANEPFVWYTGSGVANPFAGDVTVFYITNSSGATANISIRILHQST